MDTMSDERPVTLAEAYALQTPQDSRRLYARWAATYESEFVALNQYVIPYRVAVVFAEVCRDVAGGVRGPVLDVGCGTELVAVALVRDAAGEGQDWLIDGVDISPEMLAVVVSKSRPTAGRSTVACSKPISRSLSTSPTGAMQEWSVRARSRTATSDHPH